MLSPSSPLPRAFALVVLCLSFFAGLRSNVYAQQSAPVPAVDTAERGAVLDLYRSNYLPSVGLNSGWTGSVTTGEAGTVSNGFLQGTLRRINYFRSMSGLRSDITFDAAHNAMCQQAALMMSAEQNISHAPPSNWTFYTADAADACAASDIRLDWQGDEGALAIDRFIADDESNNTYVGHRRWLLFADEAVMASGTVPGDGRTFPGTNATWVTEVVARPADAPDATSWPPAGFVPAPLVFRRWSFSYLNADFSAASVSVVKNGAGMSVTQEAVEYQTNADGSGTMEGDNTVVWELPDNVVNAGTDETYQVTVNNVKIDGKAKRFTYTVTTVNIATPTVSLSVLRAEAYKNGKRGKFLVTRTGDVSTNLTVRYTVGGTAQTVTAYKPMSGSVTIPAGSASTKVKVVPVDGAADSTVGETVTVTLQDGGSSYAVSESGTGTVTIQDTP